MTPCMPQTASRRPHVPSSHQLFQRATLPQTARLKRQRTGDREDRNIGPDQVIGTMIRYKKSNLATRFSGVTRRPARRPAGEAESVSSSGEAAYMGEFRSRQQRFRGFFGSAHFSSPATPFRPLAGLSASRFPIPAAHHIVAAYTLCASAPERNSPCPQPRPVRTTATGRGRRSGDWRPTSADPPIPI
jgi:hypothetical protein